MEKRIYGINLNRLTAGAYFQFPDSFKEYSEAVLFMLKVKHDFLYEESLIEEYKDDAQVKSDIRNGMPAMDSIRQTFPDRFISAGKRKKGTEDFRPAWFDLWNEDYVITPEHPSYDLFFVYKLRQTDILELDNLLTDFLENYDGNQTDFIRFLKLTMRKHSKKLLQTEQIETINEWLVDKEKEIALSGTEEQKTRSKIKRTRDEKVTLLNQEQTALLAYCLRETKIILNDEFLNNKETAPTFSIYPNPSNGNITAQSSIDGTFEVYTIEGQLVNKYKVAPGTTDVQLPNSLASGIYLGVFRPDNGSRLTNTRLVLKP